MTALLSDYGRAHRSDPIVDMSREIAFSPTNGASLRVADREAWGKLWPQLRPIESRHQTDDEETPKLTPAVLNGARRLIRLLEDRGERPPTLMTGTCDATIVFEWHASDGGRAFRSLDVLSENEAEEFQMDEQGRSELRRISF